MRMCAVCGYRIDSRVPHALHLPLSGIYVGSEILLPSACCHLFSVRDLQLLIKRPLTPHTFQRSPLRQLPAKLKDGRLQSRETYLWGIKASTALCTPLGRLNWLRARPTPLFFASSSSFPFLQITCSLFVRVVENLGWVHYYGNVGIRNNYTIELPKLRHSNCRIGKFLPNIIIHCKFDWLNRKWMVE